MIVICDIIDWLLLCINVIGLDGEGWICLFYFELESVVYDVVVDEVWVFGFVVYCDVVGNLFVCLFGCDCFVFVIYVGLYLDIVVQGGVYDGQVGVVGGLVLIVVLLVEGCVLFVDIVLIVMWVEESVWFFVLYLGLCVVLGCWSCVDLQVWCSDIGCMLVDYMCDFGFDFEVVLQMLFLVLVCFVEIYIEQGLVLYDVQESYVIVIGVWGGLWYCSVCIYGVWVYFGGVLCEGWVDVVFVLVDLIYVMDVDWVQMLVVGQDLVVIFGIVDVVSFWYVMVKVLGEVGFCVDLCLDWIEVFEVVYVCLLYYVVWIEVVWFGICFDLGVESCLILVVLLFVWQDVLFCVVGGMLCVMFLGGGYDVVVFVVVGWDVMMIFVCNWNGSYCFEEGMDFVDLVFVVGMLKCVVLVEDV